MQSNPNGGTPDWSVEQSIYSARGGSFSAVGQILDHYRGYLLAVANEELKSELVRKIAPSDLVQETSYEATRNFSKFAGGSEAELRAWLRQILIHNLRDAKKRYHDTHMRDCSREVFIHGSEDQSGIGGHLVSPQPSPSHLLMAEELQRSVTQAMGTLSDEQRRVIELRSFDSMSFAEVGRAIGKSAEAARKIWGRAIEQISGKVASDDSSLRPPKH